MNSSANTGWRFTRAEKIWLAIALVVVLAFGFLQERRTALRHAPMTDLGVFCIASGAVWSGQNPYNIPDWHGWHYQYPPALAILFFPFAEPVPLELQPLPKNQKRTAANTPWGYQIDGKNYYGLHADNAHFFFTVAAWYLFSVLGILFSTHALACTLEEKNLRAPPPEDASARRRWWRRRLIPLLACAGSLGTDLARGQADILMLAAIAGGIQLVACRKKFSAGLCFALPATIKLFPPLLLAYPLLRRQWRMAFGVLAGLLILLAALPAATLGIQRTKELYQCWIEVLAKPALGQGTDTSRVNELTGLGATDNQSMLAVYHNWIFCNLALGDAPADATAPERDAILATGVALVLMAFLAIGFRRHDSPQELLVVAGLLVGLALLVNPIVHNFYYLLLLPLVSALVNLGLAQKEKNLPAAGFFAPVIFFMIADLLARLPVVGQPLRGWGVITASLLWLLGSGAVFLARQRKLHAASQ